MYPLYMSDRYMPEYFHAQVYFLAEFLHNFQQVTYFDKPLCYCNLGLHCFAYIQSADIPAVVSGVFVSQAIVLVPVRSTPLALFWVVEALLHKRNTLHLQHELLSTFRTYYGCHMVLSPCRYDSLSLYYKFCTKTTQSLILLKASSHLPSFV